MLTLKNAVGLCRLCASLRKNDTLITITDDICRKVKKCCDVDIVMNDPMPKSICDECVQNLQISYAFYTKVHESLDSLVMLYPPESTLNRKIEKNASTTKKALESKTPAKPVKKVLNLCDRSIKHKMHQKSECEVVKVKGEEANKNSDNYFVEIYELLEQSNEAQKEAEEMETLQKIVASIDDDDDEDNENLENMLFIENFINDTNSEVLKSSDTRSGNENQRLWKIAINSESAQEILLELADDIVNDLDDEIRSNVVINELKDDEANAEELMEEEHLEEPNTVQSAQPTYEPVVINDWNSYSWCCYMCSFEASNVLALHEHAQEKHAMSKSEFQYKCTDCQKICSRYYTFLNHVRMRHHQTLAFRCDVCDEQYDDYKQLAVHRREDCEILDYPMMALCGLCGKGYLNETSVQTHAREAHGGTCKIFTCEICNKDFKRSGALRAHQRVHSDVRQFTCEQCGRAFRHKINLDVHLNSHIPDKPFECAVCKKSYKTSVNLEKHALIHTEAKTFKCDHCEKFFRTRDAKLSHERTHTGEMPYQCEYCERRFRFRSTYMSHVNVHTGERPYSCMECDHHFTNWSNYNKHLRRRHSGAPAKTRVRTKTAKTESIQQQRVVRSRNYEQEGERNKIEEYVYTLGAEEEYEEELVSDVDEAISARA